MPRRQPTEAAAHASTHDCPADFLHDIPLEDEDEAAALNAAVQALTALPGGDVEMAQTASIATHVQKLAKEFFKGADYIEFLKGVNPATPKLKYITYALEYIAFQFYKEANGEFPDAKKHMLQYMKFLYSNGVNEDKTPMTKQVAMTMRFIGIPRKLDEYLYDYFVQFRERYAKHAHTHTTQSERPRTL
jgi:hypothetical protein